MKTDNSIEIACAIRALAEAVRDASHSMVPAAALIAAGIMSHGCQTAMKASPLLSDGDEIASVGTVTTISPHPSWAAPIGGSQWISIAQTGWPLFTWLPNGTVISFSEVFSLASMPSVATVTFAADDSASLWLNGSLVLAEAPIAGNGYTVCSDTAPTCTGHATVDVLPWLVLGNNVLRFDVAQRGGWSYGLNYAVGLAWLDEPLATPESGTGWMAVIAVGMLACFFVVKHVATSSMREWDRTEKLAGRYRDALNEIYWNSGDDAAKAIARKALEESK